MLELLPLPTDASITEACPEDAAAIAEIHLATRQQAMPYLRLAHTTDETRGYFAGAVCDRPQAWWVLRHRGKVIAYMLIDGEDLDHLYVAPPFQGLGFGSALLAKAKTLSPQRIERRLSATRGRAPSTKHAASTPAGRPTGRTRKASRTCNMSGRALNDPPSFPSRCPGPCFPPRSTSSPPPPEVGVSRRYDLCEPVNSQGRGRSIKQKSWLATQERHLRCLIQNR